MELINHLHIIFLLSLVTHSNIKMYNLEVVALALSIPESHTVVKGSKSF